MKIANIIYENELINHIKVEYVNYYNEQKNYNDLDKLLPTLYVGWSFMKICNPNNEIIQNADILKKIIINNELYWEFSFQENKPSHIKGIDKFIGLVPQFYFMSKYDYVNIDPIFYKLNNVDDIIKIIPEKNDVIYNYKNEIIYLLFENKIIGLSLKLFEYFKFNIFEILEKIQERTKVYCEDIDGNIYQKYYKLFPNFEFLKRYIVIMLSK